MKTVIFDRNGRIVARARAPFVTRRPAPGLAEQDPESWVELIVAAVAELRAGGVDLSRVAGIGLSGRGANAIFLDAADAGLAPCWLDRRAAGAARALAEAVGEDLDYQTRSLASKAYYLKLSQPDLFARLALPLFCKDFLLYRLTGVVATDPSEWFAASRRPMPRPASAGSRPIRICPAAGAAAAT